MTTIRKLIVEVSGARNLLPKDGMGTSSPYVVIDFDGQRKRTQTVHRDLNPKWNEVLEFHVDGGGSPSDMSSREAVEIDVYHDRRVGPSRRNNFLGRVRLNAAQLVLKGEEALVYYPLEKKSFFSWIRGDIGLKVYYVDETVPPPTPPENQATEKPDAAAEAAQPEPTTATGDEKSESTPSSHDAEKSTEPEPTAPTPTPTPDPDAGKPEEPPTTAPPAQTAPVAETQLPVPESTHLEAEKQHEEAPTTQTETDQPPPPPTTDAEITPPPDAMFDLHPKEKMSGIPIRQRGYQRSVPDVYAREATETFSTPMERSSYDLVEKMHYLFVRVVKARSLQAVAGGLTPFVKISVSRCTIRAKTAEKMGLLYEWDQTFAFDRDAHGSASTLEVSVWNPPQSAGAAGDNFLGGICFDASEIPLRDPPDSPLAPQWYRLEGGGASNRGDLMLATWIGTQADESFSEAWKTDTSSRSKVYLSPKLWYLRATILEAQDIQQLLSPLKETAFSVKSQYGFQTLKTRTTISRNGSPSWNEDLIFVAAEPFSDDHLLVFSLENRFGKDTAILGLASIPLSAIERRVDEMKVVSRWITLQSPTKDSYNGRLHVRVCFDGGYHVTDEPAHMTSDFRPTARQLWKPPIGTVELGMLGCRNLVPVKTISGKGTADTYAVAKYGEKWVRSRTVADSLEPRWNEQYTWPVYDPCTVLSVGVFDSADESKDPTARQDVRMGKIRIRISTLENNRVYKNTYPLIVLLPSGAKKMGEIELAVRFARSVSRFDLLHVYGQPMLPRMHYLKPMGVTRQESLRQTAARLVALHLLRSEPPLRREVVLHMLDTDSHAFSMRKVRANWLRILNVLAGVVEMARWVEDTRAWRNPTSTAIAHVLLVLIVWHPELVVPTFAFYTFSVGAWNCRLRRRDPLPHPCAKISLMENVDRDELDEEFDTIPSSRPSDTIRMRYDRLRMLGFRVQTVVGDVATHGERVQALVTWRDPRATAIFIATCLLVSVLFYVVPTKMLAVIGGFYYLRHPMFRDRMPTAALNFFRRLPSLSERIM